MSLQLPVLDDVDFEQLMGLALEQIAKTPRAEWTAASEGDPGRMLIEVFAYLTDQTIYRLNRLPLKVYVAFLRLLGVTLHPPTAAGATLEFAPVDRVPSEGAEQPPQIEVPRGTRITTGAARDEGDAPVFVTLEPLRFSLAEGAAGKRRVAARHCTWVQWELLGAGTGLPGLALQVAHPPIVASFGDDHTAFDVRVWVETDPEQGGQRLEGRPDDPRTYLEWREAPGFTASTRGQPVYTVDRLSGTIQFAPAVRLEGTLDGGRTRLKDPPQALGALPGQGKQVLISYGHGGGARGNVLPGTLTRVLDPIVLISPRAGDEPTTENVPAENWVKVANPKAAGGGQEAETLENALLRGPLALYVQEQAVTARDYERIVQGTARGRGEIARARALTKRDRWAYAEPGTVEVLMVPAPPEATVGEGDANPALAVPAPGAPGAALPDVSPENLTLWSQEIDLASIDASLTRCAALGTQHEFKWAHYKRVDVRTDVLVDEDERAPARVEAEVLRRLNQYINPFYDPRQPDRLGAPPGATDGWPFGRSLDLREIETLIQETPGVAQVRSLSLHFAAPSTGVRALAPDSHHADTWYAGSQGLLYRSLNGGLGWEAMREFRGERILAIRPNPDHPGLLALVTEVVTHDASTASAEAQARVYVSTDCGETWTAVTDLNYAIQDLGWLLRANMTTILLLATDQGLREYELLHERRARPRLDIPSLVPVDPDDPHAPLYALAVLRGQRGQARVAVALKSRGGVYVSSSADLGGASFEPVSELDGYDVRHLAAQQVGQRSYLWAGTMAEGNQDWGCYRLQLGQKTGEWFDVDWQGGSCRALAFEGSWVHAATQWGGILKLDLDAGAASGWKESTQRDTGVEPSIPKSFLRYLGDQREDYDPGYWTGEVDVPASPPPAEPPQGDAQETVGGAETPVGTEAPAGTEAPDGAGSETESGTPASPEAETPGDASTGSSDGGDTPAVRQLYRSYWPLWTIAADASGTLMAAGEHGILRRLRRQDDIPTAGSTPEGPDLYELCSATEVNRRSYRSQITLPYDGLFVSGTHAVNGDRPHEDDQKRGRAGNAQP